MPLDRKYLQRREKESLAAALFSPSKEAAVTHSRFAKLYHAELEKLRGGSK